MTPAERLPPGMTLVHVASRRAVYEETPPGFVAQVFATEAATGSAASVVPALGAGLLIDVAGVPAVPVATGCVSVIFALSLAIGSLQHGLVPARSFDGA